MNKKEILLTQVLAFAGIHKNDFKIHCASDGGGDYGHPLVAFYNDSFRKWQERQTKPNFNRKYILSLIKHDADRWLFTGIYESISFAKNDDYYYYNTELREEGSEFIGRLLISFEKKFRSSYLVMENHIDKLYVSEILSERMSAPLFPGYENIRIGHDELQAIIKSEDAAWKTALSNIKGIYLISDSINGRHYVGSVYGEQAFWTRWASYSENGHGGNIELIKLIREQGKGICSGFYYSILEVLSFTTTDEQILKREIFWKDKLMTREFGYNKN